VTFEVGSKLRQIENRAFSSCKKLGLICLPASVSEIDGATFLGSHFMGVVFERGNKDFYDIRGLHGSFVMAFSEVCAVAHFGEFSAESHVACITGEIQTIGTDCCASQPLIRRVSFESPVRVRVIRARAFADCTSLIEIVIPRSVREIGDAVFRGCRLLSLVEFESKSALTRIGAEAFHHCPLSSMCIPSSVEFVGKLCFQRCYQLKSLSFEFPSHVRELRSVLMTTTDRGLTVLYSVDIPDSVEILDTMIQVGFQPRVGPLTLNFGNESKLQEINFCFDPLVLRTQPDPVGCFVRTPAHCVKALRRNREYEP
jgi:hypothetical protein